MRKYFTEITTWIYTGKNILLQYFPRHLVGKKKKKNLPKKTINNHLLIPLLVHQSNLGDEKSKMGNTG
jgi:hypothetical protein